MLLDYTKYILLDKRTASHFFYDNSTHIRGRWANYHIKFMAFFNNYNDAKNSVEATDAYYKRFKRLFLDNVSLCIKPDYKPTRPADYYRRLPWERSLDEDMREPQLNMEKLFDPWFSIEILQSDPRLEAKLFSLKYKQKYYLRIKHGAIHTIQQGLNDLGDMVNRAAKECIKYKECFFKDEYQANQLLQQLAKIQEQCQNVISWFNFLEKEED